MERLEPELRRFLLDLAPSPRQLAYLRALASKGTATFAEPVTRAQAAEQIARLSAGRRRERGRLDPVTRSRPELAADSWRPFLTRDSSSIQDRRIEAL